jgi:hypothetical protein
MSPAAQSLLAWVVLPLWFAAGLADWLCHRRTEIEHTAGTRESVLHLLMFAEMAVPLLACLFLDINALVFAIMIIAFIAHELTAWLDITYAAPRRYVSPFEQQVHSFLEIMPLAAGLLVATLHWPQLLALFGLGDERARFTLALKPEPLPLTTALGVLAAAAVLEFLPYLEELWRGLKARARRAPP